MQFLRGLGTTHRASTPEPYTPIPTPQLSKPPLSSREGTSGVSPTEGAAERKRSTKAVSGRLGFGVLGQEALGLKALSPDSWFLS